MRRYQTPELPQVLLVQARLVQEHPDVEDVAFMCGSASPLTPAVNQLTAACIYAACGCRLNARTRKIVREARSALGNLPSGTTEREWSRWQQRLIENVLVLAKRTTLGRQRGQQKRQP